MPYEYEGTRGSSEILYGDILGSNIGEQIDLKRNLLEVDTIY